MRGNEGKMRKRRGREVKECIFHDSPSSSWLFYAFSRPLFVCCLSVLLILLLFLFSVCLFCFLFLFSFLSASFPFFYSILSLPFFFSLFVQFSLCLFYSLSLSFFPSHSIKFSIRLFSFFFLLNFLPASFPLSLSLFPFLSISMALKSRIFPSKKNSVLSIFAFYLLPFHILLLTKLNIQNSLSLC